MNIVVVSAFRNARRLIRPFAQQVRALWQLRQPDRVRLVAVEGDSLDDTPERLKDIFLECVPEWKITKCDHGQPQFGSVESAVRFAALSLVVNAGLEQVEDTDDVFIWVESDLVWSAETISELIDAVADTDIVAPLTMAGDHFYDTWAFRGLDGQRFAPFAPYHSSLNGARLTDVNSVGSCLAAKAVVARRCRVRDDLCLVGFCNDARRHGYRVSVIPSLRIKHP
jgi:Cryptococcal mannosyltransferase 1